MKKNNIACFAAGALLFGTIGAFAGQYVATDNPFPVKLNGNDVQIEGYNIEGSTYFKLRDIADTVGGFEVGFQNNTIQLSKDGYVYEANDTNTLNIPYYTLSQNSWAPDYGAYHNQLYVDDIIQTDDPIENNGVNNVFIYDYPYNEKAIDEYMSLLISLNFNRYYLKTDLTYTLHGQDSIYMPKETIIFEKSGNYITMEHDINSNILHISTLPQKTPEQCCKETQEFINKTF